MPHPRPHPPTVCHGHPRLSGPRPGQVERDVLRAALAQLADEGLVGRRRGRGTIVVGETRAADRCPSGVSSDAATDHLEVAAVVAVLTRWEHVPASPSLGRRLDGVAAGDGVLRIGYEVHADGHPQGVITVHLRGPESTGLAAEDFTGDLHTQLHAHGVDVDSHDITVSAQPAATWVADVLRVAPGSPVQVFAQTIRDPYGARIGVAVGRLCPELCVRMTGIGRMAPIGRRT